MIEDARPPKISNRRNVRGEVKDGSPTLYLNAERHAVTQDDGRTLPGFRGSGRDIPVVFAVDRASGRATLELSTRIGESPKFVRALHKIAFACLAYHSGH